jgi:uncharacterized protein (TIGR00369 family)
MEEHSHFAEFVGIEDIETKEGECRVALEIEDHHLNMGGVVHGGVLSSLLDFALGAAVVTTLDQEEGEWCATQSLTTDFMRPVSEGRLAAVGRVDRRGASSAYPSGEVRDEEGDVVARATGIWAVRGGDE